MHIPAAGSDYFGPTRYVAAAKTFQVVSRHFRTLGTCPEADIGRSQRQCRLIPRRRDCRSDRHRADPRPQASSPRDHPSVVAAEAESVHSHGLARLPTYCEHAKVGKIDGKARPVLDSSRPGPHRCEGRLRPSGHRFRPAGRGLQRRGTCAHRRDLRGLADRCQSLDRRPLLRRQSGRFAAHGPVLHRDRYRRDRWSRCDRAAGTPVPRHHRTGRRAPAGWPSHRSPATHSRRGDHHSQGLAREAAALRGLTDGRCHIE